ncbi:hypothetical protein [Pedobacter caeni]|uniref:Mannosyltransferase (PIG-V) n=1 Tax=Pedobacter caeni TaxID=288992 RepID=A0A1M5C1A0_9SPHI|nr:hypothetical protein [Pedobacter caeni]SHF48519.1 hypothetical protein SAMN04488522_1021451 [Pedobacter caeni]
MNRTPFIIFLHLNIFIIAYLLLLHFQVIDAVPDEQNLLNWDAFWYHDIREKGYVFVPSQVCNMAFFPLFPFLWKLSQLSAVSICLLNLAIFVTSFYLLIRKQEVSPIFLLIVLGSPSFIFFALPYSESLSFMFAAMILLGYRLKCSPIKITGFLLAATVRSVSLLFIPAIILTEILTYDKKQPKWRLLLNLFYSIAACTAGLMISACVQFRQTGRWFYFLDIQQFWKRHWIFPKFPLTTYDPERIIGVDGAAFVIGSIAAFHCLKWIFLSVRRRDLYPFHNLPKAVVFSALCLAGTTFLDTFFTFNVKGATNIWSLNRHLFCSPFFLIYILWLVRNFKPEKSEILALALLLIFCVYFTGVYQHTLPLTFYVTFFCSLLVLKFADPFKNYLILFYLLSLFIQVCFLNDFLHYKWIG